MPLRAPTAAELAEHFGAAQDWPGRWHKIGPDLVERALAGHLGTL